MKNIRKFICWLFDHPLYFDTANVARPSTCKCGKNKELSIIWPRE